MSSNFAKTRKLLQVMTQSNRLGLKRLTNQRTTPSVSSFQATSRTYHCTQLSQPYPWEFTILIWRKAAVGVTAGCWVERYSRDLCSQSARSCGRRRAHAPRSNRGIANIHADPRLRRSHCPKADVVKRQASDSTGLPAGDGVPNPHCG